MLYLLGHKCHNSEAVSFKKHSDCAVVDGFVYTVTKLFVGMSNSSVT